jgi:hypothetical protein
MTTPQQTQQPPPQAQQPPSDDQVIAAIATALVVAVSALAAVAMLQAMLRTRKDVDRAAVLAALSIVMGMPPEATGVSGSAALAMSRTNTLRRAQFAWSSAKRLTGDILQARSDGKNVRQALAAAITRERRYFGQHRDAMWNRMQAAMNVDMASWSYGDLLGWYTVRDARTSAECLAADGRNFYASEVPVIGYPGAVHPHCRCYPGPAHVGGRMLPSVRAPQRALVRA